jgi:hypothetical protein
MSLRPFAFVLEQLHRRFAVEPEEVGVGAHKAEGVGRPGKLAEITAFDRGKVLFADEQIAGNIGEFEAVGRAHFREHLAQPRVAPRDGGEHVVAVVRFVEQALALRGLVRHLRSPAH